MTDMAERRAEPDVPPHRYTAELAAEIELRWQGRWEAEATFATPNPARSLADPERVAGRPKMFLLDMFPYPSGAGLHVGHPLGYIGWPGSICAPSGGLSAVAAWSSSPPASRPRCS